MTTAILAGVTVLIAGVAVLVSGVAALLALVAALLALVASLCRRVRDVEARLPPPGDPFDWDPGDCRELDADIHVCSLCFEEYTGDRWCCVTCWLETLADDEGVTA